MKSGEYIKDEYRHFLWSWKCKKDPSNYIFFNQQVQYYQSQGHVLVHKMSIILFYCFNVYHDEKNSFSSYRFEKSRRSKIQFMFYCVLNTSALFSFCVKQNKQNSIHIFSWQRRFHKTRSNTCNHMSHVNIWWIIKWFIHRMLQRLVG